MKYLIDFEINSNIESKVTLGLLNTNYTDFSDTPIFSKKNSNFNNYKYNQLYHVGSSCSIKSKTKKSRNQEIQFEIEQNSIIQLNIIMQNENYAMRNDYIISISFYIVFTIVLFWLDYLVFSLDSLQL